MNMLRGFYFHGINNKGATIGDTMYYPYEPNIAELASDIADYVKEAGAVYDHEHGTKSKWYGGFDDLGWVMDAEEDNVRYGD